MTASRQRAFLPTHPVSRHSAKRRMSSILPKLTPTLQSLGFLSTGWLQCALAAVRLQGLCVTPQPGLAGWAKRQEPKASSIMKQDRPSSPERES